MQLSYDAFVQDIKVPNVQQQALDYALANITVDNGLLLEFGVWQANSIYKIARKYYDRIIYGFDSFEGLPETWERTDGNYMKGAFSTGGKLPVVPENVKLVKGWFNDTLPSFISEHKNEKVTFIHIDCDLYSSTKCVFDELYKANMLADKVLIVFDELVNYSTYKDNELKALWEFMQVSKYNVEWIGMKGEMIKDIKVETSADQQAVACWITRS